MKMKWLVLGGVGLFIIGIVLVLLLAGVGLLFLYPLSGDGGQQLPSQESVLHREDLDGDGVSEKFTYVFPKEEVGEDVFLQRTAVYEEDAGGSYRCTLVLEFENTGSGEKTFTHVEKIPKSFAAHVRDLDFDVPPTEILEEDPTLSWEMRIVERNKVVIKIGAAVDLGVGKVKEKWSEWFGGEQEPSDDDAVAGAVMAGVGDIEFEAAMLVLNRFGESSSSGAGRTALVAAYPGKFTLDDCETIGGPYNDNSKWACRAILTEDWRECANSELSMVDLCKEKLYGSLHNKNCKEVSDPTLKDLCAYKAAVKADWSSGCYDIADKEGLYLKEKCFAEVTQDMTYCKKIPELRIMESCCRTLMNPDEQAECLGINATTTTTLYPTPTKLEALQQTNTLYVTASIYGKGTETEDGARKDRMGQPNLQCQNQLNLTWNGRLFSGSKTWTRDEFGRTLEYRQVLEGAVTEEGDKVVWLTCEWYRDDMDDPQATEIYRHKFNLMNVPLNQTLYGSPVFEATIQGPATEHYLSGQPESYDKQTRGAKVYEYIYFLGVVKPPENTDIKNMLSVRFMKQ